MRKTREIMHMDDISAMVGRDAIATLTGPERSFLVYRVNGMGHLLVQVTFLALDMKRWTLMFTGGEAETYTAAIQYGAVVVGRDIARLYGGDMPPTTGACGEQYDDFN